MASIAATSLGDRRAPWHTPLQETSWRGGGAELSDTRTWAASMQCPPGLAQFSTPASCNAEHCNAKPKFCGLWDETSIPQHLGRGTPIKAEFRRPQKISPTCPCNPAATVNLAKHLSMRARTSSKMCLPLARRCPIGRARKLNNQTRSRHTGSATHHP